MRGLASAAGMDEAEGAKKRRVPMWARWTGGLLAVGIFVVVIATKPKRKPLTAG